MFIVTYVLAVRIVPPERSLDISVLFGATIRSRFGLGVVFFVSEKLNYFMSFFLKRAATQNKVAVLFPSISDLTTKRLGVKIK